ncbi:MAG: hypothetical protein ACYCU0_00600 [Solirubrobacteraceae bacterium]
MNAKTTTSSVRPTQKTAAKRRTPRQTAASRTTGAKTTATRESHAAARRTHTAAKQTKSAAVGTAKSGRKASVAGAETIGAYAERAVLIPVGAALIARDRIVESVSSVVSDYGSPSAAQVQLHKFERRGTSARNKVEREARRTRVRLERELRRRKRELDKAVGRVDAQRETIAKSIVDQVDQTSTSIEQTVHARLKDGTSLAAKLQDKVLELV